MQLILVLTGLKTDKHSLKNINYEMRHFIMLGGMSN